MFQLHLRRFVSLSLCLSLSWFPSMEIELLAVTSEARKCFIHSYVTRIFKSFFFFLVRAPRPPRRRKCRGDFFFSCVGTLATPAANLHRQLVRQLIYNVFVIYFMYHFTCGKLNDMKILKCFIVLCPRL